jgi:hypothetical protein
MHIEHPNKYPDPIGQNPKREPTEKSSVERLIEKISSDPYSKEKSDEM